MLFKSHAAAHRISLCDDRKGAGLYRNKLKIMMLKRTKEKKTDQELKALKEKLEDLKKIAQPFI